MLPPLIQVPVVPMLLPSADRAGVVVGQQDHDLGVVGGGEAHEGHHGTSPVDGGLRGARLAADACSPPRRAFLPVPFSAITTLVQDLPAACSLVSWLTTCRTTVGSVFSTTVPSAAGHRLDHIGLEQLAAVDGSGEGV